MGTRASTPPSCCWPTSACRPAGCSAPYRPGLLPDDGRRRGRPGQRAARGCGIAWRFELAIGYAQQRHTFGHRSPQHQAIQFKLAEMATKVEAAHQMMVMAARRKDSGGGTTWRPGWQVPRVGIRQGGRGGRLRIHGGYALSPKIRDRAPLPGGAAAHRRGHRGDPEDDRRPAPCSRNTGHRLGSPPALTACP